VRLFIFQGDLHRSSVIDILHSRFHSI